MSEQLISEQMMNDRSIAKVGTPATMILPIDQHPYVVTEVKRNGAVLILEELKTIDTPSSDNSGPYPVMEHTYTPDEIEANRTGRFIQAGWSQKRKCYVTERVIVIRLGKARFYMNLNYD